MRKSGHSAGVRPSADSGEARSCRPKRMSHSGPERYVIVAISIYMRGYIKKTPKHRVHGREQNGEIERRGGGVLTACELEARVRRRPVIVESVVPVRIGH
jgi:hypothetical protein